MARHFTDREVALILRKATELQNETGRERAGAGLSIEAIRDIAQEIGVPAELVDRAVASLGEDDTRGLRRLLGGPLVERYEHNFPGNLTERDQMDLVDTIRRTMGVHGHLNHTPGGLEWKSTGPNAVAITLRSHDDEIAFRITADRRHAATPIFLVPTLAGLMVAGIVVDGLQPGMFPMMAILASGAGSGFAVARAVWSVTSKNFRQKVRGLRDRITGQLMDLTPGA